MRRIYKQPTMIFSLLLFLFLVDFTYISCAYVLYGEMNIIKLVLVMIATSELAYLSTMLEEIEEDEIGN